ncbi:aminotransferase class V-fold PLP-dependent enzyme [Phenylobacterium sp.]|uniref:aminotransferase class V-fold PLP-dependent enzyme n=1 Tax=Phenylobacterium sp. TaxID=1871053 RepID=UPI001205F227|nr:aminotransferase class V-fold PLP-dependent enzyme [Phenylobacterium sp.]THD61262.1 MAG: aminotransferase class V-fold PLP-dependent enzyme [Phenylobacterium sp.]
MDLARIRADTPAAEGQAFLHSAGSSLMPSPVVEAMIEHLRLEQDLGGYAAADREQARLDGVYDSVAALLNAGRDEIALVENATVGWQMAFYALAWRPGDRILTGRAEYAANYVAYLQTARRYGVVIDVIPDDAFGAIDPDALRRMIDERVKLISITWIPTNGGLTNPAAAIGEIAREAGVPYLLDACQAAGQMPVDVRALGCDMLAGTGRKFLRGPRGTGFLYVRRDLLQRLEPPMIDHFAAPWTSTDGYTLRPDARRFETWENNYAARLGLGVAADYARAVGLEAIEARCRALADRLREGLRSLDRVSVLDLGRDPCAIVSFSIRGYPVAASLADAAAAKIVIGASPPASTRLDSDARGLGYVLRASPHYFNTEGDVDRLIEFCAAARTK